MNSLRPYQIELIEGVRQAYREGFTAPCIVLACGGGKSVIVAELARRTASKENHVLFLVHRQELCDQIKETFRWWGVNMKYCRVIMVQTATRRLKRLKEPKLIITDENHHCLAASYKRIYEYFKDAKRVGVTATPIRLNGGGLGDVNDKLVEGVSTKWLIDHDFLAPFDYYAPSLMDMDGIHTRQGDYVQSEIYEKLNRDAIYGDVISYYKKLSLGKQAICYCTSVLHSTAMADQFRQAGVTAAHIDGTTPSSDRKKVINQFRAGRIMVLCNVDLISEGFDVPDCNTAILLRPTKSLTLFIQQSMRCMRYKSGKRAVIIDHVGNYKRFGLPDQDRHWDLTPKRKGEKKQVKDNVKVRQCPECFYTHEPAAVCPHCGFMYPIRERTIEEIKEAKLEIIKGFVLDYSTPDECQTMGELLTYAKQHNYKRGWAFYQAKMRGIV